MRWHCLKMFGRHQAIKFLGQRFLPAPSPLFTDAKRENQLSTNLGKDHYRIELSLVVEVTKALTSSRVEKRHLVPVN
jgi:hypothetical protein